MLGTIRFLNLLVIGVDSVHFKSCADICGKSEEMWVCSSLKF
jgi:hypothetical protein